MSNKDTGGPVFPGPSPIHQAVHDANGRLIGVELVGNDENSGLTLRDWFAGQALAGILAHQFSKMVANVPEPLRYDMAAIDAYVLADAMLKERSK